VGVLKSQVGSLLRHTNPARFPHRESIRSFFTRAIEAGAGIEIGEGATKVLSLKRSGHFVPTISLADHPPISFEQLPQRVVEVIEVRPYLLFAPWSRCPPGNCVSKRVFVQSFENWAILMFHSRWRMRTEPQLNFLGCTMAHW
jgi:hypothetical protein